MNKKYVIGFLVESNKRNEVRDTTNILKKMIENYPNLKLIDCGYVTQQNLNILVKYMNKEIKKI